MSMLKQLAMSGGATQAPTYVDDVFSANTYIGNRATNAIINGIDLLNNGGIVWTKIRDTPVGGGSPNHAISWAPTPASLMTGALETNTNSAILVDTGGSSGVTALANGYSLSTDTTWAHRNYEVGSRYASWTFRKAPKFFDVVTYTGNGANRTIPHSLNQEVGLIFVKRTDVASDWQVYHRSLANTEYCVLNTTAAKATGATRWNSTTATSSVFSLGTDATVNANGGTYVAYLFAHDASTDGIIQCGSFTTDVSGNATVNLGWEPQFAICKCSSVADSWWMWDTMREWTVDSAKRLLADSSGAESASITAYKINNQGFRATGVGASRTYIYLAIRRPNKPPTTGTQVYNAIARTGTGAAATVTGVGFAPDSVLCAKRGAFSSHAWGSRLLGTSAYSRTSNTDSEFTETGILGYSMDGFTTINPSVWGDFNFSGATYINYFFKRAVGVFDVVCYTGDGSTTKTLAHNLTVAPNLIIAKKRSAVGDWGVYCSSVVDGGLLNTTDSFVASNRFVAVGATSFDVRLSGTPSLNDSSATYVAYLFATKAGISKVGSYPGNGTTLNVDCGFVAGARFILIKRTDAAGDWYVWDSTRGIVAGNDPHLSLNTTVAEVTTDDSIDPYAAGFTVNQDANTNINVNGATYIFLAIG